jgi:hypothetical protein
MPAEQIIALEAALADLSEVYSIARGFAALQARAESELLPQLTALGAGLRRLVRAGRLDDAAIGATATEMLASAAHWRSALDEVRASAVYQHAVRAVAGDRQAALADVIPRVFAHLRVLQPPPDLYFPVSPSAARRRPGANPFLSPAVCADKLLQLLAGGIPCEPATEHWWERELPSITGADTPAALESPIAVRLAAVDVRVAVFAETEAATVRVFTPRLHAPLSIVLARDATDEWWEAYQDSYRAFRDALRQELAARGQIAAIT